jgi:hypothetical protein
MEGPKMPDLTYVQLSIISQRLGDDTDALGEITICSETLGLDESQVVDRYNGMRDLLNKSVRRAFLDAFSVQWTAEYWQKQG